MGHMHTMYQFSVYQRSFFAVGITKDEDDKVYVWLCGKGASKQQFTLPWLKLEAIDTREWQWITQMVVDT